MSSFSNTWFSLFMRLPRALSAAPPITRTGAPVRRPRIGAQIEVRIGRKELRRLHVQRQAGPGQFALPGMHVADAGPAALAGCRPRSAAAAPARRPMLKMSSSALPISRLRPWMPPASSPTQ